MHHCFQIPPFSQSALQQRFQICPLWRVSVFAGQKCFSVWTAGQNGEKKMRISVYISVFFCFFLLQLLKKMSSSDTPLGTVALLQEKQKSQKTPYIVLSGSGKSMNAYVFHHFHSILSIFWLLIGGIFFFSQEHHYKINLYPGTGLSQKISQRKCTNFSCLLNE